MPTYTAYEPRDFSLSTSWTNLLAASKRRTKLVLRNLSETIGINYAQPERDNPWALSFDGSQIVNCDAVVAAGSPIFGSHTGEIVARFKLGASSSGVRTIFSVSDASAATEYLFLAVDASHKISASLVRNVSGARIEWAVIYSTALTLDEWYVVSLRQDGTSIKLYVNGVDRTSPNHAQQYTPGAWFSGLDSTVLDTCSIGKRQISSVASNFFNGVIDFVYVYDGVLGSASRPRTDLAVYNLDEGSGATATDISANADHGTITSGAMWTARNDGVPLSPLAVEILSGGTKIKRSFWAKADSGAPILQLEEDDEAQV